MEIKNRENLLYKDLTYQIRGACFEIWKNFGGSFKESVVDKALTIELRNRNLQVNNQKKIDIYYKNEKVGTYIPDKVINDKILIEIKCKPYLTKEDERQFWTYLKGSNYKIGLLVNFGSEKLEIKRRIYDKARERFRVNPRSYPRLSASTNKGFTLVEIMVTIVIFVLIISSVLGIFVSILRYQARALAKQELLNQTSYAIEYMGRALRMAKKDESGDCLGELYIGYNYLVTPDGESIKFINQLEDGICQEFFLDNYGKLREVKEGSLSALTSDRLQVNYLKFKLSGESETDNLQPRVTILFEAQAKGRGEQPEIKLQTTVSQRNLDEPY